VVSKSAFFLESGCSYEATYLGAKYVRRCLFVRYTLPSFSPTTLKSQKQEPHQLKISHPNPPKLATSTPVPVSAPAPAFLTLASQFRLTLVRQT
jgi:hypothetical protein